MGNDLTMTNNIFRIFLLSFIVASEASNDLHKVKNLNEVHAGTGDANGSDERFQKSMPKSKTEMMANVFRKKIQDMKAHGKVELVILVDGSSSIGEMNFRNEMKYIQKVVSNVDLNPSAVRLAVITYSSGVATHVNHLRSEPKEHEKCSLLHYDLPNINYTGGSTNTRDALIEAERILFHARPTAKKVVFLVTDGFSNRGDPVPVAEHLKRNSVIIYSFGIENGNVEELRRIASRPVQEHLYLFRSFDEFEGFERRALHQDLKLGTHVEVDNSSLCNFLCEHPEEGGCCIKEAKCTCGTISGHFTCLCPPGYYGTGLQGEECKLCPNGTYNDGSVPGDDLVCFPCPDIHQVTLKAPATSKADCVCADGYVPDGNRCKVITCPELSPPTNGYFVKKTCSNVLNAACGMRCHMGFTLSGSSIRICQKNATWSGTAPTCVAKRCEKLKSVANADLLCVNDEDNFEVLIRYNSTGDKVKHTVKWGESVNDENGVVKKHPKLQELDPTTNETIELNYTVDTECRYNCLPGYFLVGSKMRSCLPMLKWSGLKNTCKAIKCHSIQKIENGIVTPESCTDKGIKHHFAESCFYSCNSGYELKGPNVTNCTGRHGTWSEKNNPSKCIDVEPPKFDCPDNLTIPTDEGVHFGTVPVTLPNAIDNSGKQPIIWSKPPIGEDYPLKFVIGTSDIEIYSVDDSGNYAFCSFKVTVEDIENPKILECESPPSFFVSEFPPNSTEIKWKEPIVDDNSGVPIPLKRNPTTSEFPLGVTTVVYTAIDYSGNNASCSLNITILENPCSERPELTNTIWNCLTESNFVSCNVSCSDGFAFAAESNSSLLPLNCTFSGSKAQWTPDLFHGDMDLFPECSETETPSDILGEIVIDATEELCNDLESLSNDLTNEINSDPDKNPWYAICEDDVSEEEKETEEEKLEEDTNVIRRKRATRRKKLRIGFSMRGGKERKDSKELLLKGLNKTEEKVKEFYAKHQTPGLSAAEGIGPTIKKNVRLMCRDGFLLKENICVKCPRGTFHNVSNSSCDSCSIGQYQETEGQLSCKQCPKGFSTRKIRRKHPKHCRKICPPGTFAKKKPKFGPAVSPCTTCPVGHFQPSEGQIYCEKCPENFTTLRRGSIDSSQCVNKFELEDLCFRFHCRNGGTCFVSDGFAICKCPPGYLGAFCERRFDPCASSPCYNSGECVVKSDVEYKCKCPGGFEGDYCEKEINECASNPCGTFGECIDLFDGFRCDCFSGFKGETCKERISQCEELQPCLNQGTCVDVNDSYKCFCSQEFSGFHCEEPLNCTISGGCENATEYIPDFSETNACWNVSCGENEKCKIQWNRQPACVCFEGLRGENCFETINPHVVLNFPKYGVTEYLSADFPSVDLIGITICMWIQTKDNFNYGTLFSYASFYDDNAFTLTDYSGLVLYVSGNHTVTDLIANDGFWHFICVTWQRENGQWKIYLDGSLHSSGSGLANNSVIPGSGKLIVGQEQDFFGGGFNELESFSGRLTYFNVWDRVLEESQIKSLYEDCDETSGSLITWSQILQNVHGRVLEEESDFCQTCPTNLTLFRGQISYEQMGQMTKAKYVCDNGFFLKFDKISDAPPESDIWYRRCMKYGHWERKEPKCSRVSCGFPGYFIGGKILGGSYFYGDVIQYQCEEEYTLIGNDTRVCQANGSWSGHPPTCQGNSNNCRKLVAPRHGSMFVYFTQRRSYGRSLPAVGDRIEFTCDKGYSLKGFGILTCLEGGIWDRESPSCEEIKCLFPKEADHLIPGRIPRTAFFYFGDPLTITCAKGGKKTITCGEFGAWNFTQETCGSKCLGRPPSPENGYIIDDGRQDPFFEEGEVVFVKCKRGFILLGDNCMKCSELGTWVQFKPTICDPINCGPPPHPPHPYFLAFEEGYRFRQKVVLECLPGYRKTGEIITLCGPDGRWSRIQNTCERHKTTQLKVTHEN